MTAPERIMLVMKLAFLISCVLFLAVILEIPSRATHPPQHVLELAVIVIALANVALAFATRPLLARFAKANSRNRNASPLGQWFSANVLSLALIESCALFAVVLHTMGSSTKIVTLLFVCPVLALLIWRPGKPPATEEAGGICPNR